MKKLLLAFLGFIVFTFGYAQSVSKDRICFQFINQFGSSIKPDKVEITDNEGNTFQLFTDYCFDYYSTPNYAFAIIISDVNYYDYEKTYYFPIPETDTIVLGNIITMTKFFIKSETPILTDDEIKHLRNFFSESKYGYNSLTVQINVGKYNVSEFQSSIVQIFDLYLRDLLPKNLHNSIEFSIGLKNNDLDNVFYLFEGLHCK